MGGTPLMFLCTGVIVTPHPGGSVTAPPPHHVPPPCQEPKPSSRCRIWGTPPQKKIGVCPPPPDNLHHPKYPWGGDGPHGTPPFHCDPNATWRGGPQNEVSNSNIPPPKKTKRGAQIWDKPNVGLPLSPPFYFKGKKLRNGSDAGIWEGGAGIIFSSPPQTVFVFPVSPV